MDEVSIAKVGCTGAAKEVRDGNFEIGKIDTTEDDANNWHNEVIDEGANDFIECATDDDTNSEVDDIATVDEVAKFFENRIHFFDTFLELF